MDQRKKFSFRSIITTILGVLFLLWMVMGAFPTGWLYDLGVGTGTAQGQRPNSDVQVIKKQDDVKVFLSETIPATVVGEQIVPCPLMRLRDTGEAGEHKSWNRISRTKRSVVVTEYRKLSYPISFVQRLIMLLVTSSSYNQYYLVQLEDGSYICAFFDDYHMLKKMMQQKLELPTGYVRYSTGQEQQMLLSMAEDYEVNPSYVLDMYRDGKGPWILDKGLRLVLALLLGWAAVTIVEQIEKKIQTRR